MQIQGTHRQRSIEAVAGALVLVATIAAAVLALGARPASAATVRAMPPGDAYVAVCGDPRPNQAHCDALVATGRDGAPLAVRSNSRLRPAVNVNSDYGYSPQNFHTAYNLPWRSNYRQTIAIVDAFDHPQVKADLDYFDSAWGLGSFPTCSSTVTTACFQRVDQTGANRGFTNSNATAARDWDLETEMDVQAAHGICLNCKILLVEAYSASTANLAAAVNTAARLGATEISNSYGSFESGLTSWNPSAYSHPGVAITASTGDNGYGPQYPADLNTVVAVGGTRLLLNTDGSYNSETVWGNGVSAPTGDGAGSGCSTFNSTYTTVPTWQRTVANWGLTGCGTRRSIADVAADADPATGAWVYNSRADKYGRTGWFRVGGTSLSAPLIAGVYGLAGGTGTGVWAGSIPYARSQYLRDVTSGTNGTCSASFWIMCQGTTGYDGPTGLGTPYGIGAF